MAIAASGSVRSVCRASPSATHRFNRCPRPRELQKVELTRGWIDVDGVGPALVILSYSLLA